MRQRDEEALAARIAAPLEPEARRELGDPRARRIGRRSGRPCWSSSASLLVRERQQPEHLVEHRRLDRHTDSSKGKPERVEQRVERVPPLRFHYAETAAPESRITSRIASLPVSTIASRSIPIPQPPVGGIPYESAST